MNTKTNISQVVNVRQLTCDDVNTIKNYVFSENNHNESATDFEFVYAIQYSNEELVEQNYIIGEVTINEVVYYFIHGFPGDEPNGVLYTPDFSTIVGLHWSMDRDVDPLCNWYLDSLVSGDNSSDDSSDDSGDNHRTQPPSTWFVPRQ